MYTQSIDERKTFSDLCAMSRQTRPDQPRWSLANRCQMSFSLVLWRDYLLSPISRLADLSPRDDSLIVTEIGRTTNKPIKHRFDIFWPLLGLASLASLAPTRDSIESVTTIDVILTWPGTLWDKLTNYCRAKWQSAREVNKLKPKWFKAVVTTDKMSNVFVFLSCSPELPLQWPSLWPCTLSDFKVQKV